MGGSSIKAGIQLNSFKMDKIEFNVVPKLSVLASVNNSQTKTDFNVSFRNVIKFSKNSPVLYVTGLRILVSISQIDTDEQIANGEFIITGLFSSDMSLPKEQEDKLIKHQAPAILFPYLRSDISSVIASSGFSLVVLPLINIYELSKTVSIEIVESE